MYIIFLVVMGVTLYLSLKASSHFAKLRREDIITEKQQGSYDTLIFIGVVVLYFVAQYAFDIQPCYDCDSWVETYAGR